MLLWDGGVPLRAALMASPILAQGFVGLCAVLLALCARGLVRASPTPFAIGGALLAAIGVLAATLSLSHAASRLDHRSPLLLLTALHHLGMAVWIGAMPYLLLALPRAGAMAEARTMARRYSAMALAGAALLLGGGLGLAWFYVGSPSALYGTAYGVVLLGKVYLLLLLVALGAGNWFVVRRLQINPQTLLLRLRRFAEVEIGLGFTAILATASLVSQPPAIDLVQNRLTAPEIKARFHIQLPRMHSPPVRALAPPSSMEAAVEQHRFGYVTESDANDIAWSEYNHHWAGLIVALAGVLALLSRYRRFRWARYWPLSFAALAVLILLRADAEGWPLGPRSFWKTFSEPDVLVHRLAALLVLLFAVFECGVQAGKIRAVWATFVFPAMCALGAALLLTHSHGLANVKEELLGEITHSGVALLGLTAGWARWLELRLPEQRSSRIAAMVWPLFLMLAGLLLLDYREA